MANSLIQPSVLAGLRELQTEDDLHFVRDFFITVLATIPPRLEGIKQAIERSDFKMLVSESHALKSTCANTEIAPMTQLCAELEALGKSASVDGALQRYEQLILLSDRLRVEITALPEFADTQ